MSPSKNGREQFTIPPSRNEYERFTISDPEPLTHPTEFLDENGKGHVLDNPDPDPLLSDLSSKKKTRDNKKSAVNKGNMISHTHNQAMILICPTTVTTDASNVRRKAIGKRIISSYAHV